MRATPRGGIVLRPAGDYLKIFKFKNKYQRILIKNIKNINLSNGTKKLLCFNFYSSAKSTAT
jgi:hypothetical protein